MAVQLLPESGGFLRLGLYGEVGTDITASGVTRALREADGRPITISVDSYGGDALAGIAIHNILAKYPGKKRAIVEGVAASAASLFPLAADERIMPTNAFVMIHNAWGGVMGGSDDMREQADLLDRISASYRKTYESATALNSDEINELMGAETWIGAEDALMSGFATQLSDPREIKASAVKVPEGRFTNLPEALRASVCLEGHNDDDQPEAESDHDPDALINVLADELDQAEEATQCPDGQCPVAEAETESGSTVEIGTVTAEVSSSNTTMSDLAVTEAAIAAREDERARAKTIRAICAQHQLGDSLADQLIDDGSSVNDAREVILNRLMDKKPEAKVSTASPEIGLSQKEAKGFSLVRAYLALANPADKALQEAAAYEFEVSRATQARTGRSSAGISVPMDVLKQGVRMDLTVGVPADGGNLVDDVLRPGDFIELLRNRLALNTLGATTLAGLQGDISIPRQASASQAYWVGEGGSPTESNPTVDQVQMSPKTVGAFVDYSRKLLLQSSIGVEAMVRDDLTKVLALEIDRAGLYGSGTSNQPLGLSGTSGISTQELTDYGSFAELVAMETNVATANADQGSLAYLMNAASRGALKTTEKASGTNGVFVYDGGEVNGYRAEVSNQVAAKDVFFGDWSQMVIGLWGSLDLMVDPYAGSTSGTVRVIALQSVDFAVKQPTAFCLAQDLV